MEAAGSQEICRLFMNGSCRFGSRCFFRHELPFPSSSQICRYFIKGQCWFGEQCRYRHVLQPEAYRAAADRRGSVPSVSSSSVPFSPDRRGSEPSVLQSEASRESRATSQTTATIIRPLPDSGPLIANTNEGQAQETNLDSVQRSDVAQQGASQGTNEEPSSSDTVEDGAAVAAASGSAEDAGAAAAAPASSAAQSKAEVAQAFLRSKEVTCGICMDKVYEKPDSRDHVFGILPNCSHSYCLKCIRTWRKSKDFGPDLVKNCPQCRVSSAFYVPHKYWVEGQEKDRLIAAFKQKFGKRRCHFYSQHGYCPFKAECLHRHDKPPAHRLTRYTEDEDDSESEDMGLFGFFIAMTFLSLDEDDDDFDWPFFITED
ncbi:makorin, ring finger protein, 4 [Salarias fasciatus]|uniref:makorin, ring finger protein, 4 n=1 Tax=Salarias fasciatus TaxID=181472 RepID=UPI0011767B84|nr:probable E3 ubiquitin-protein ligase makorin-2 [Salarias fasciatus]